MKNNHSLVIPGSHRNHGDNGAPHFSVHANVREQLRQRAEQPLVLSAELSRAIHAAERQQRKAVAASCRRAHGGGRFPTSLAAKIAAVLILISTTLWVGSHMLRAAEKIGMAARLRTPPELAR